jgi:hypothetical protein
MALDTQGLPGTPNIVQAIFERISNCSVFVADISFVARSAGGRCISNPNVLIELGYAARSIGWDRTILVLNSAFGAAADLPFDILQHRWPIEYRVTAETQVKERRADELRQSLSTAIVGCQNHVLARAREMAAQLDAECLGFIGQFEKSTIIEIELPALTMGEFMVGINRNLVVRRLMELGALEVLAPERQFGYRWTRDGLLMINEVRKWHPNLLHTVREHYERGHVGKPKG